MNTFDLTLDLAKAKQRQQQTIFLRQGDKNATTIVATITDHGVAASTSGLTARFQMKLPDGTHYYRKSATLSGNVATVTIDETEAASSVGRTDTAYFQLLQGSTVVASTESFTVVVLPDALADATVPESYDSAIQDAIDALDDAVEQMPDMVEDVLEAHPEWTTTVQDGSITASKLATDLARDRERLMYRLANMLTATLPEGEMATATDAAKTPLAGLALYGRSTQDGTPTPSSPVPIVSVVPDSQGNISMRAQRTSDASDYTMTHIPLDGHELRSLPDGTRDEVTVDSRGHAVLVQRVFHVTLDGVTDKLRHNSNYCSGRYSRMRTAPDSGVATWMQCDHFPRVTAAGGCYILNNMFVIRYGNGFNPTSQAELDAWFQANPTTFQSALADAQVTTIDLGTIDPVPLVGPDLTAQAVPTAPMQLTYERDLDVTLARLESAIANLV